jgi:hypothetical protein
MAAILGLPLRNAVRRVRSWRPVKPILVEEKRTVFRKKIQAISIDNPRATRTDFHRLVPNEMQWLLKNDRNWLVKVLPKAKKWGSKVDWDGRDRDYSARVESVKKELIALQRNTLFRITSERMANALHLDSTKMSKGHYPKTYQAIQAAAES